MLRPGSPRRGDNSSRRSSTVAERGADPIEVDTDGVYFVPPDRVADPAAEETFVNEISQTLPRNPNRNSRAL